ncbi:hypothetical protein Taro_024393 [Colocasia esculenta]|uniref:GDSL esterase/lipase n=1 Tax=Colocasia esculenta TaxID=4460 RepID=A0A843V084_COLES|nr:hypothetical protein [Colocasia esculenta]
MSMSSFASFWDSVPTFGYGFQRYQIIRGTTGERRGGGPREVPAVFVFGDSVIDVGNNQYLPNSTAKANFPPNGIDFPGGKPTGRFSNGFNIADYVAQCYGFEMSPPAFLSLSKAELKRSICNGINFASAGSGVLNTIGVSLGGLISMDAQLDYFRTSLDGFTPRLCSTTRRVLLSKSIFLLSAASNDLLRFYMSNASKTHDAISKFITSLASKYRSQILETLYSLGARRFAILGLGLNGCTSMRFVGN